MDGSGFFESDATEQLCIGVDALMYDDEFYELGPGGMREAITILLSPEHTTESRSAQHQIRDGYATQASGAEIRVAAVVSCSTP